MEDGKDKALECRDDYEHLDRGSDKGRTVERGRWLSKEVKKEEILRDEQGGIFRRD